MPVRNILFLSAFAWLVLSGALHIAVDVVSQHLRAVRVPGRETTLYDGLHTGYSLGQILFGAMGLLVTVMAAEVVRSRPMLWLLAGSSAAWVAFALFFIEYTPPKVMVAIYAALILSAALKS